jgi:hypothetical protein
MAINTYLENNLLLNLWPKKMQENITTFNQLAGRGAPLNANCDVYIQDERDAIADALDVSINMIGTLLNYWPRPKWYSDVISFGQGIPSRLEYFQTNTPDGGGSWKLHEFGTKATTLIQAAALITYSDVGGYGVNNTATITVPAGALTNTDEIQLFFQVSDGAPGGADPRYQIESTSVVLSGGNFVITANRSLFVKPSVWATPYLVTDPNNQTRNAANNADLSTDFVTAVDVYRVWTDPTTQIEVLDWNNNLINTFDGVIVNSDLGLFTFHHDCWDGFLSCCCRRPIRLRVNYKAGEPLVNGQMNNRLLLAIIRLANTIMPVEICPMCSPTKNAWEQDRNPAVKDRIAIITQTAAQNAFGIVTYGAVYAYQTAVDMRIPSGGKLTHSLR